MKISSYHTHTYLCNHATGKPIDYVQHALLDNCKSLGFSDHCPYPDGKPWANSRMKVSEIPLYIELINEAKKQAPFPIHWGFECEWDPQFESWYKDFLKAEIGAEYLIYGSHWLYSKNEFHYIPENPRKEFLKPYVDLTVQALQSGIFDMFAHPDLFLAGYTSMNADVKAACIDIIDAAVDAKIPMEINGSGLQREKIQSSSGIRHPYPVKEFWEMAAEKNAILVCNSDAHTPEGVLKYTKDAMSFADELGIQPIDAGKALGFVY